MSFIVLFFLDNVVKMLRTLKNLQFFYNFFSRCVLSLTFSALQI